MLKARGRRGGELVANGPFFPSFYLAKATTTRASYFPPFFSREEGIDKTGRVHGRRKEDTTEGPDRKKRTREKGK